MCTVSRIIFSFALFVALVLEVRADRLVNISLVVVDHPASPSPEDQIRLFKEGIKRLKEVKIKTRIIKTVVVPDFYSANSLNDFLSRLYTWSEYGKQQRFKGIVFYLLPPMFSGAAAYGAGQAGAICVLTRNRDRKFAEGVMRLKSTSGFDREPHSRIIALHEMLHLVGGNHIAIKTVVISKKPYKLDFVDVPNVMHPNAQAYATIPELPILSVTKRQVRYCKQGKNVLGGKL